MDSKKLLELIYEASFEKNQLPENAANSFEKARLTSRAAALDSIILGASSLLADLDSGLNSLNKKVETKKRHQSLLYYNAKIRHADYIDIKANNPNEAINKFRETHPQAPIRDLIGHRKNPEIG